MHTERRHLALLILTTIGIALLTSAAHAQTAATSGPSAGVLDFVSDQYKAATSQWASAIQQAATWLFWTLATISMTWTFGMMALRRADISEVFAEFVRFTIFVGFYFWLLEQAIPIGDSIFKSMRLLAAQAGNVKNALEPSGVVDVGFEIFFYVLTQSSVWAPIDSLFGFILGLLILILFASIAVDMLLLLVSSWFLLYAGIFFLGFGGSRWTSEMAIGYYRHVLSLGVQLFAMVLLVAIGKTITQRFYTGVDDQGFLFTLAVLLVVAYVEYRLTSRIPSLLGGLVTGTSSSGASAAGSSLADGIALGTTVATSGAFAVGGAMIAATAVEAGGAWQAVRAATQAARTELGTAGGTAASNAGPGPLSNAFGDSSSQRPATSSTSPATASAARPNTGVSKSQPGGGNKQPTNSAPSRPDTQAHRDQSTQPAPASSRPNNEASASNGTQRTASKQQGAPSTTPAHQNSSSVTTPNSEEPSEKPSELATQSDETQAQPGDSAAQPAEEELETGPSTPTDTGTSEVEELAADGADTQGADQPDQPDQPSGGTAPKTTADAGSQKQGPSTSASAAPASGSSPAPGTPSSSGAERGGGPTSQASASSRPSDGHRDTPQGPTAADDAPAAPTPASTETTAPESSSAAQSAASPATDPTGLTSNSPPALRTAMRAGQILAGAAASAGKAAWTAQKEGFKARVAASVGGRLADAIRQQHMPAREPPAASEIAAFQDQQDSTSYTASVPPHSSDSAGPTSSGSGPSLEDPDTWATGNEPMTVGQQGYLQRLCDQAGRPFDPSMSKADASKLIQELQPRHNPTGVRSDS